ncbi:MAG TPA: four helix bundle protein [Candidatus Cloacimonadota bacterium]|nr:four helix bundle protein [Candidatus Cloacimonadota bacterium]HPT73157.1 four helix bundle protein [Candidatus Cloacimonadota bacterium]
MHDSILKYKSYDFALMIVKECRNLITLKEYVLSRQLLRSGTSIGALVREAEFAQSKSDFINKLNIALKEANETDYWLSLLKDSSLIDTDTFELLDSQCKEMLRMLVTSIKTLRNN